MSLPTRAQFWVLAGHFLMMLIFMLIKYDLFEGNVRFKSKAKQLSFYVAYRAGVMSVAHLPLLVAFAGRNNILAWLTGWSFDTFNLYHRWLARFMFILAFIHAVSFTVFYNLSHRYTIEFRQSFLRWGIVAVCTGGVIMFLSLRHFRENMYDVFLVIHWVLVSLFFAGVWWHLHDIQNQEWLYAAIALWAFDRLIRLIRISLSSAHSIAELELHHNPQLIKIKVKYSNLWEAHSGHYVFVHFVEPLWSITQSHPFSCYHSPVAGEKDTLVLCMRVLDGKTKRIAKVLSMQQQNKHHTRVLLDGPYGHHFPLANSDTIVLIAGGIGITAIYSYACRLRSQCEKKRVILVWIVRNYETLETFNDELNFIRVGEAVEVQLYVTEERNLRRNMSEATQVNDVNPDVFESPPESPIDSPVELTTETNLYHSEKNTHTSVPELQKANTEIQVCGTTVLYGRPDLKSLIQSMVAEAPGSIVFMACGPPRLNDDVRKTVTENMDKGRGRVDLYLESYNW